jgi:hypothetical protein
MFFLIANEFTMANQHYQDFDRHPEQWLKTLSRRRFAIIRSVRTN